MQLETDTIVALATPPGRGGIGVVRLSGPAALSIARAMVRLQSFPVRRRRVHYGVIVDHEGKRLDDALLTWFQAPASYTGEDVVEISAHGAPVVLHAVVDAAVRQGARLARAGEFTERAYLAGKLDLTAAEAVRDLIDAQTLDQARLAAQQLGGSLAREVAPLKQELVTLIATLEAGIDFAEDDLDTLSGAEVAGRIEPLLPPLALLEQSFTHGRLLREGLKLAIVGKPNAGKSSLFNRLLGRNRAIVTPVAGTTRDVVSESLVLDGIPIHLLDTAGLRDTADPIERIGVERTHEAIAEADFVLQMIDATQWPGETNEAPHDLLRTAVPVFNKADLLSAEQRAQLPKASLVVSAATGEGLLALQQKIVAGFTAPSQAAPAVFLTNFRQHAAVLAALETLQQAHHAASRSTAHELLLLSLYATLESLDNLTGKTTHDDVLHQIFSTFCIGK